MKKECARIFSDKQLFFAAVLMPGILLGAMYFLMGNFMSGMFAVDEDYIYQVHAVNMPGSISAIVSQPELQIKIIETSETDVEKIKQQIAGRDADLLVIFPENFDGLVAAYEITAGSIPPNVQLWSNMARTESMNANNIMHEILSGYHHALTHKFSINAPSQDAEDGDYGLATDADMFAMVIGFMVPLMLMIFLYTGCMSLAPESISGEKERGTLGGMLVTPARRSDIAFAKILSISIFVLMSAVISMIAMVITLPSMIPMDTGNMLDFYSVRDLLLLFTMVVTTALVFVSVLSLLSAYAKSVKEATAYATPLMIVVVLCGFGSTMLGGVPGDIYYYFIPVFNSALSITSVIDFEVNAVNILATAGVNILFTVICAGILAKMFGSEKIVFDK
jgi:sodium transport system permease protein